MRALISGILLRRLRPGDKPFEIRDSRLKGFLLRIQPSGAVAYYVEYARGKRVRIGAGELFKPDAARARALEILAAVARGSDPALEARKARAKTFGSFIEREYRPWAEVNIRTANATVARLKANFPEFQDKRLTDITPWLVDRWRIARLQSGAKVTTVNRDLDDLKSSMAKAVVWGLLDASPIARVKRSKIDGNVRVRCLSEDEETRLRLALDAREERLRVARDHANEWRRGRGYLELPSLRGIPFADHLKPLILISLNTGLRQGELFGLDWRDVDLERKLLTIGGCTAKSGQTRYVPLNREAATVFEGWRRQHPSAGELVFPGRYGERLNNVRSAWERVLSDTQIAGFRWHDMRHHFASRLVSAGVDLNTVRELLGHSNYQMTLRYAHLAPEHKAAAVSLLVKAAGTDEVSDFRPLHEAGS